MLRTFFYNKKVLSKQFSEYPNAFLPLSIKYYYE